MDNQELPGNRNPIKKTAKSGKKVTFFIFLLLIAVGIVYFLTVSSVQTITKIRDLSIILFVFESLIICFFLVILIIQFSILINLIQNEIKPILKTSKDTVNHIKGTVEFLGDNMVEPVIQTNSKISGFIKIITSLKTGIKNQKGR